MALVQQDVTTADTQETEALDISTEESGAIEGVAYDGSLKSFADQFPIKEREKLGTFLDETDLKILWTAHGLPTYSYIMLAVRMEGDKYPLNPIDFADRWCAEHPMTGKMKELKPEQVEQAFVKMRKSNAVQYKQASIDFTLNF